MVGEISAGQQLDIGLVIEVSSSTFLSHFHTGWIMFSVGYIYLVQADFRYFIYKECMGTEEMRPHPRLMAVSNDQSRPRLAPPSSWL